MIPAAFEYARPASLDEALRLLRDREGEAKVLAGGFSLIPLLRFRLADPGLLVDIGGVDGLAYIRAEAGEIVSVPAERAAALRAPCGLDLGATTAGEVAVSILAEIVQVRRGRAPFVAAPGPATLAGPAPGPASAAVPAPVPADIVLVDPVCGMTVDADDVRHIADHEGITYAFCAVGCRTRFVRNPARYLALAES